MTDEELAGGFAARTLDPAGFGHREHLRVAWLYLRRYGRAEAEARLIAGLRALAVRAGRPEKFDEALTRVWVARIAGAAAPLPPDHSFDELLRSSGGLLDQAEVGRIRQTL